MAPFPEEVDVFTVPHSKMKHLVESYSEMLSCTDFSNCEATETLLHNLHSTFCVFKSHERIENEFIMYKLKSRLKALDVSDHDSMVCNCHSDNRMAEMLRLVREGYDSANKTQAERIDYGRRLVSALREFTRTFLPHMKEEEEVFQPMLVKYFEYEELKILKDKVIEQHERFNFVDRYEEEEETTEEGEEKFYFENKNSDQKPDFVEKQIRNIENLPPELILKVFSYLWPPDLSRCARVSCKFNQLAYNPSLWHSIVPSVWSTGIWDRPYEEYYPEDAVSCGKCVSSGCHGCEANVRPPLDEDADIDESFEGDDNDDDIDCKYKQANSFRERIILDALCKYVLPKVGINVRHLSFAGSFNLDGKRLATVLSHCPNVGRLDLSYSNVSDESIFYIEKIKNWKPPKLTYFNLSGCRQLTDDGFKRLASCLIEPSKLTFLSLSGCSLVTDGGIRSLFKSGSNFVSLNHLDLSGCWDLSGLALTDCVQFCPKLNPENLYYCDHITDGPYQEAANGCQNLECPVRSCCCLGYY